MAMYFVQHGLCVAKETNPDRPLSDEGRHEVQRVAERLGKAGVQVGKIYHSGKTRARQTAELLAAAVGAGTTAELPGMQPNDHVLEFTTGLADDTMYVGHLPHLAKLVSFLITAKEDADVIRFSNGGVICIGKSNEGCHVEWYITPVLCRE